MERVAAVYVLGGIALASELPLPELPQPGREADDLPCVTIRLGDIPPRLPKGVEIDPDCFATSSEYLLSIQGVARYLVAHGSEIVIELDQDASMLDVRGYLLGAIFAVLCHQRGLLPLHASAVTNAKGAIAFLAPSGQGKSSLAAHLAQRGFRIMADDICLVDARAGGTAMVIPATPWLKLWRASLQQLGRPAEGLEQVFSEDDKYRLPIESALQRQPIHKVVLLERSDRVDAAHDKVEIEEVSPLSALPSLMSLTHQADLLDATGARPEHFRRCGQVLSQAKAYRLIRPWGFEHMDSTIDKIEEFLRRDDREMP